MVVSVILYLLLLAFAIRAIARLAGKPVRVETATFADQIDTAPVDLVVDYGSVVRVLVET